LSQSFAVFADLVARGLGFRIGSHRPILQRGLHVTFGRAGAC
jgi:hypothetical protein